MGSLRLKNISKRFGDVVALSGINLHVNEGEFCVLLGPSGCGKSTLLQIVAGLTQQDQGKVFIDGRAVDQLSPRERDVAMVFQNYALYPHMSVAQNLGFGLRMRGVSKNSIEKRIIETAEILGIEKLLNRKPKELSGGQQQRVAMGRALVRRPKLFLLDEPLSNLDARLRVNVRLELKSLHQQIKATIVYVTHDQVEAMSLGDKVVVMREGEVHQIDRPEFIYDQPADTFVASFIGSPVINLFSGRLTRFEGRLAFQTKDFCLNLGDMDWNFEHSDLEIGIRPEDIRVVHRPDSALKGVVEMITNVGAEKYVYSRMGSTSFTVRAPKSAILKPGEVIYLGIDPSTFHFFYSEKRVHTRMQLDRLTTNFERY